MTRFDCCSGSKASKVAWWPRLSLGRSASTNEGNPEKQHGGRRLIKLSLSSSISMTRLNPSSQAASTLQGSSTCKNFGISAGREGEGQAIRRRQHLQRRVRD